MSVLSVLRKTFTESVVTRVLGKVVCFHVSIVAAVAGHVVEVNHLDVLHATKDIFNHILVNNSASIWIVPSSISRLFYPFRTPVINAVDWVLAISDNDNAIATTLVFNMPFKGGLDGMQLSKIIGIALIVILKQELA